MQSFFKTPEKRQRNILMAGDLASVACGLLLTFLLQVTLQGNLRDVLSPILQLSLLPRVIAVVNLFLLFTGLTLLLGLFYLGLGHLIGLYQVEPIFRRKRMAVKLLLSLCCGTLLITFFMQAGKVFTPRMWVLHAWILFTFLFFWRVLFHRVSSREPYRVLLVDEDPLSASAVQTLSSNGAKGLFRFRHITMDELFGRGGALSCDMIVYPYLSRFSHDQLMSLVTRKFEGVSICNSLTFYKNSTGSYPAGELDAGWLINLSVSLDLKNRFQQRIKRFFDILAALAGILLFLPLMTLIAAAVRLTSKGPVFFIHERLGMNRKPFRLFKFRTMVQNAEAATGPVWAVKNDPRITPVGRILRKTRLDELPQFFNVLVGDMSIVGPRPIRKFFADKLALQFPYYFLRFSVRPGLTGWAQVQGDYGDTVEGQLRKLEYELFYINEYSLLLDASILFRTVKKMVAGAGQ